MDRGQQFPYTYTYRADTFTGSGRIRRHIVEAHHPESGIVGTLSWYPEDSGSEIENISVDEAHQGRGVATGMYLYAKSLGVGGPEHSSERTHEGNGWAHAMVKRFGGHLPRWGWLEDGEEDV